MDYLYYKVSDAQFSDNTTLRRAFKKHLKKVSGALRAIEWNDSGDGDDREDEMIRACLTNDGELRQACEDAIKAKNDLEAAINQTKSEIKDGGMG